MDIEGFVDSISTIGVSSATITTYRKRLTHLTNWMHLQNMDIHQIGFMEFQSYCDAYNWSNATRNLVAAVVRHYAKVMLGRSNPLSRLRIRAIPPRTKKYLNADQIRALLDTCSGDAPNKLRTKAAICLMVDAGLYPGEICSMLIDQIDVDAMKVRISGKTAFDTAWFSPFTAGCVRGWLDVRPDNQLKYLFVGSPQMSNDRPLTPHALRVIINDVGTRAGIDVAPFALRTTYVRVITDNGLSAEGMQWAVRRANGLFSGYPLTSALVDEIRAALPFADW